MGDIPRGGLQQFLRDLKTLNTRFRGAQIVFDRQNMGYDIKALKIFKNTVSRGSDVLNGGTKFSVHKGKQEGRQDFSSFDVTFETASGETFYLMDVGSEEFSGKSGKFYFMPGPFNKKHYEEKMGDMYNGGSLSWLANAPNLRAAFNSIYSETLRTYEKKSDFDSR
jgi:hypothetical protein